MKPAIVLVGLLTGAVLSRLTPQWALGRYNWGLFGYFSTGVVGLVLSLAASAFSFVAAGALAAGGLVAGLLRIGEDYGRSGILRNPLGLTSRAYWRDVVESLRYLGLALLFLSLLAALYAATFRLVWGERF